MGLDNMLAVAGASHGSYAMVMIGLAISIPIMVFGSTVVIRLINRFPLVIDIGAAVIAYTAGKMITDEPFLQSFFDWTELRYCTIVLVIIGVLLAGNRKRQQ